MKYYSTRDKNLRSPLKEAVLSGLAPDGGLFMPEEIPIQPLPDLTEKSLLEIAFQIGLPFICEDISESAYGDMIERVFPFDAPLVELDSNLSVLELFHGPTLAFKDFGARFMAELMSYLIRGDDSPLTVLAATSGDTGSAVAHGFLGAPNINVVLLYPSGRVSTLQEKQLTTCGKNITALSVEGSFDDCQRLVKEAFLNTELRKSKRLTSANSINIARLLPQSFYYFRALAQLKKRSDSAVFSVPSGNFGNLTAGILAKKMGAPISRFLAATNQNKIVPEFLRTDLYTPAPSIPTLSNAMDVGNPSNFERLTDLLGDTAKDFAPWITGHFFSDEETLGAIREIQERYEYSLCPHTAVGALALAREQTPGIVLATAHPIKFTEEISRAGLDTSHIKMPEQLKDILNKESTAISMPADKSAFFEFLSEL